MEVDDVAALRASSARARFAASKAVSVPMWAIRSASRIATDARAVAVRADRACEHAADNPTDAVQTATRRRSGFAM